MRNITRMFSFFQKPCDICKAPNAKVQLNVQSVEGQSANIRVCKQHFLEEFKRVFLAHPYKMIVTHPILKNRSHDYSYYPLNTLMLYAYEQVDVDRARALLASIPDDQECAYFDANFSASKGTETFFGIYPRDLPIDKAVYLTKSEAWSRIYLTLSTADRTYRDYYVPPHGKEGIFLMLYP